jgi:D-ornithine 4,5-aminomutase subunit alpha
MGFSSLESKALVDRMQEKGLLAHGAGHLLLNLADKKGIPVRELGLRLMAGEHWDDLGP